MTQNRSPRVHINARGEADSFPDSWNLNLQAPRGGVSSALQSYKGEWGIRVTAGALGTLKQIDNMQILFLEKL